MCLDTVIQVLTATTDSHFRLKACKCGSQNVAYVQDVYERWAARCFDCGREGFADDTRHGAQVKWNMGASECRN